MANIPLQQNAPENLLAFRASRYLYARAKWLAGVQVLSTVCAPTVGAFLTLWLPAMRSYVALYGLVIALVDACVLDRLQKRTTNQAARIQEEFDCAVLQLPWDGFAVGRRRDREDIHAASARHNDGREDPKLTDWYPVVAGTVPGHFGRIICQRANLWWDGKLRRLVGAWALALSVTLALVIALLALAADMTVEAFVIRFLAPASPVLLWGIREHLRQRDSAALSDRLKTEAEALWGRATAGQCSVEQCAAQSRLFQNGIFERRSSSPPIFDWIYQATRGDYEQQMRAAASDWVREVPATTPPA